MNVDIAALRAIERDKDIPFETVIEAIETALLTAYKHTEGHAPHARVDIDRKSGVVRVLAQDLGHDGTIAQEWDDTPEGFGRIAATTARQVILQRLRDAEHEKTFGEFAAKENEIIAGVVQRDARANSRGMVVVQIGDTEGVLPPAEQVPGEDYQHGNRIKCYVVGVSRGVRGPQITLSRTHRTWCAGCSRWRSRRSPTAPWRSPRWRARPGTVQDRGPLHRVRSERQGRVHRADGCARAQRHERALR